MASNESLQLKPRRYQQDLFEDAVAQNVIAFLDTGAGKTLISVMLVKEKAKELHPELELGAGRRLTIFLAPRVALVCQQAEALRTHTDLRVGVLCGEMAVDWWEAGRWAKELAQHDLLVSTLQVLVDALRYGFLKLEWVNLLCFDEAHHATKKHPYALVMNEFYFRVAPRQRPHVFGMTASPVNMSVCDPQLHRTSQLQAL